MHVPYTGPRIKICGITSLEDALSAAEAGAHAIGLVFHPASPRYVSVEAAGRILRGLPALVAPIAVFAGEPPETVASICRALHIRQIQLHGEETQETIDLLSREFTIIKGIRMRDETSLASLARYEGVGAFLLDTYEPDRPGGTGRRFPHEWISDATARYRIIVAGGLRPENVRDVVSRLRPYGVDVSTGVESAPGVKDAERMARFVAAARWKEIDGESETT